MNFSTTPPYRPITVRATSKYRDSSSRTASGSRASDSGVNPATSQNSTEHTRRSATGPWPGRSHHAAPDGREARRRIRQRGPAGTAKTLARSDRLTARRATPHRSAAIPAEPVALPQGRTALPASHATVIRTHIGPVKP